MIVCLTMIQCYQDKIDVEQPGKTLRLRSHSVGINRFNSNQFGLIRVDVSQQNTFLTIFGCDAVTLRNGSYASYNQAT